MTICVQVHALMFLGVLVASPLVSARDESAAGWLPADQEAFRAIGQRIVAEQDMLGLSEQQAEALAERHAALLDARQSDTAADYLALMESWGGQYRVDPNSKEFIESQAVDWHAPGSPCSWSRVECSSTTIEALLIEKDTPLTVGWPRIEKGANAVLAMGSFTFGEGAEGLVRSGAHVVQVISRAETNDGSITTFGIRWVWDARGQAWLPWHVNQSGAPGQGVCVIFY